MIPSMPMATKEAQREYQRQWMAKRRANWFADKVCIVCGSNEGLELDHIDPETKRYNPATLWGMSENNPNRINELAKCQVLCHLCHYVKTMRNHDNPLVKLTEADVLEARRLYKEGLTYTQIGEKLEMSKRNVWNVVNTTWKHI